MKLPPLKFHKEYFLVLLPLFFVLHSYRENYLLISVTDGLVCLATYLLFSALLSLFAFFFFRNWRKAAVFTFVVMAFHFFFGAMHDAAKDVFGQSFVVKYSFILPAVLILLIILVIFLKKTKRGFNRFTVYLDWLLAVLILVDLGLLGIQLNNRKPGNHALPAGFRNCDTCSRNDIYLIVADEYAGLKELKDLFHFDNSAFLDSLRERGFHIVNNPKSNYNSTPHSIASTLSMNYLQGIKDRVTNVNSCFQQINSNEVISFFHSQGYDIKNYSVFQLDNQPPIAHSMFIVFGKDLIRSQTFLGRLNRDIRFNLITRWKLTSEMKKFVEYENEAINTSYERTIAEAATQSKKPRFVYMHVMLPHYPYLFDSSGSPTSPEMVIEETKYRQKEYLGYLQYSNRKFLSLLDQLFANSSRKPIVVFMSDHGFRHFHSPVDHNYHFMNLNAIYLPDQNYSGFYDGMSNVNQFRILFNTEFGQKLPLLKDSTSFLDNPF